MLIETVTAAAFTASTLCNYSLHTTRGLMDATQGCEGKLLICLASCETDSTCPVVNAIIGKITGKIEGTSGLVTQAETDLTF